jgi:hypothetical protein
MPILSYLPWLFNVALATQVTQEKKCALFPYLRPIWFPATR